jgi:hypothetical protein
VITAPDMLNSVARKKGSNPSSGTSHLHKRTATRDAFAPWSRRGHNRTAATAVLRYLAVHRSAFGRLKVPEILQGSPTRFLFRDELPAVFAKEVQSADPTVVKIVIW